ncbi:NAD(P)-binding protein [Neoconidiobolus thromboides FSU 785]|nr:NAD(P)-binding protein [Neoconidiobolus thromboides FSU 785]
MNLPRPLIKDVSYLDKKINQVNQITWLIKDIKLIVLTIITLFFDLFNKVEKETYKQQVENYIEYGKQELAKDNKKKVAIVTGATSGLGLKSSISLLKMGYKVIFACRNQIKYEAIIKQIELEMELNQQDVCFFELNLMNLNSVKQFCYKINKQVEKIDLFIANAGIMELSSSKLSEQRLEQHFQVNYLSNYLITKLLLNKLVKYNTKIIFIGSLVHWGVTNFDLTSFEPTRFWDASNGYAQSKLALIILANYLRTEYNLNVCVSDPGTIGTNLFQSIPLSFVFTCLLRPVEAGTISVLRNLFLNINYCMLENEIIPSHLAFNQQNQLDLITFSDTLIMGFE